MNSVGQNGTPHIPEDDLMMFALQSLPADQSARVYQHLQGCDLCRRQLSEIQGDLALFALTSELHELPPQAREHFQARLEQEKKVVEIDRGPAGAAQRAALEASQQRSAPSRTLSGVAPVAVAEAAYGDRDSSFTQTPTTSQPRGRRAVVLAWAGWALAAAVSVFAFLQFQQKQAVEGTLATQTASLSRASQQAAQAQAEATKAMEALQTLTDAGAMQVSLQLTANKTPQPEARAAYLARTGALVLVASHLHPLAEGKTYELWLLPAAAKGAPIPAGTFKPNAQGYANVVLPTLPKGVEAKGFGVTVEPDGGSAAPSPPILLAGF